MRRNIVVDESEYSDKEIKLIQKELDLSKYNFIVFRDKYKGTPILVANVKIKYSIRKVCDIVGKAYITGVSE